ncbi:MAG: hypothetical protein ACJ79H_13235 [Myxococcales bacterium]
MTRFLAAAALALLAFDALGAEKKKPPAPPAIPLPPVEQLPLPAVPQERKPDAPAMAPDALPPLARSLRIGVGVAGDLDPSAAGRLAASLRTIAGLSPLTRETVALAAERCEGDACLVTLGAAQPVDEVLFARVSGGALAVRVLDLSGSRPAAEATLPAPALPAELAAAAEALACKLLVPGGCTGDAQIDAPGAEIQIDGKPAAPRLTLPVGVHSLAVRSGDSLLRRSLPIVHEKPVALALRRSEGQLALLTPDEAAQRAIASAEMPAPPPRRWTRTAGYVAAGVGIVAAAVAVAEGVHSRSLLDQAERGYRANGNVYRPADLANLQSGNSAARAANILFVSGGVLVTSGLLLAFAF